MGLPSRPVGKLVVGSDGAVTRHERTFDPKSPVGQYWLSHCDGFRVEGSRRRSGAVVEVASRAEDGHAAVLVVQRSARSKRRVFVPVGEIASLDPWRQVVVVARPRRPKRTRAGARRLAAGSARAARGLARASAAAGRGAAIAAAFALRAGRAGWRMLVPLAREAAAWAGMLASELREAASTRGPADRSRS